VPGPDEVDMSKVIGALGFHTERVSEPAEVIPALRRALDVNTSGRPAYIEFICCQYPVYGQWVGRSAEGNALSKPFWDGVNQRRLVLQHSCL
jgi:hypothetical protein